MVRKEKRKKKREVNENNTKKTVNEKWLMKNG
jgi:hypothetical protein